MTPSVWIIPSSPPGKDGWTSKGPFSLVMGVEVPIPVNQHCADVALVLPAFFPRKMDITSSILGTFLAASQASRQCPGLKPLPSCPRSNTLEVIAFLFVIIGAWLHVLIKARGIVRQLMACFGTKLTRPDCIDIRTGMVSWRWCG